MLTEQDIQTAMSELLERSPYFTLDERVNYGAYLARNLWHKIQHLVGTEREAITCEKGDNTNV